MSKSSKRSWVGTWLAVLALVVALFVPAAIVGASEDEDTFAGSEFCQDFYNTNQF